MSEREGQKKKNFFEFHQKIDPRPMTTTPDQNFDQQTILIDREYQELCDGLMISEKDGLVIEQQAINENSG